MTFGWFRKKPRDVSGIEESRRLLAEAHAATPEIDALASRLEARRRENRFGPKIHAALQGNVH